MGENFTIICPFCANDRFVHIANAEGEDAFRLLECNHVASIAAIMLKNGNEQELADLRSDPQWYGLGAPID